MTMVDQARVEGVDGMFEKVHCSMKGEEGGSTERYLHDGEDELSMSGGCADRTF